MTVDLQRLSQELTARGLLIEAGYVGLRLAAMAPDASEVQVREMRMAFFAGAQHLFASIMGILDPGDEPTDADLKRMDNIAAELGRFERELRASLPTKGNA
jgi:hypothetical protein